MRASLRRGFLALAASALALLANVVVSGIARAGEQSVDVDGVRITVATWWPTTLNRGWQPAFVTIENSTAEDRTVRLTFQCSTGPSTDAVVSAVRVPAQGREQLELVLPVRPQFSNAYTVMIEAGNRGYIGSIGAEQSCPPFERVVLVAAAAEPATVDVARWASELSAECAPRLPPDAASARGHFGGVGYVHGTVTFPAAPAAAGATPGTAPAPDSVRVGAVPFENLASRPEAYTSLHALVLDVGAGTGPDRARLDAIGAWVRGGGVLAVSGSGARAFLAKEPALAAWTEPRFRVRAADGSTTYVCALGLLVVQEGGAPLAEAAQQAELAAAIEAVAPLGGFPPHSNFVIPIPGVEVPYRSLTLLLVLFAILVGPVNLILVRRSGRPALLLLTIPAISLVFSLGLVVYGALAQGLDVRATSSSVGVLDQRSHHGTSHERRQVFAGLAPGAGLRPGPGAIVERPSDEAVDWSKRREYRATSDSGLTLSGAWLPVRTPTRFYVGVDRAARGRVDIERTADGWKATNGLDTEIQRLVFRDADGELHLFSGAIASGRAGFAEADAPDSNDVRGLSSAHVLATDVEDGAFLPRNAWIARVAASPLLDPCGLEYDEPESDHVILGILEHAEQR